MELDTAVVFSRRLDIARVAASAALVVGESVLLFMEPELNTTTVGIGLLAIGSVAQALPAIGRIVDGPGSHDLLITTDAVVQG